MESELWIKKIDAEKYILIFSSLLIIKRSGRVIIHFYQFLVRQHHTLKEFHDVKPVEALPFRTSISEAVIEVVSIDIHYNFLLSHRLSKK